jgi:hypothetical protein
MKEKKITRGKFIVGPPITRSTARKYRDMLVALVGG